MIMNFFKRSSVCRRMCLLVRQNFSKECEDALNKQITMELKACHAYLAMAYHFDRCDVASPGLFKFFQEASMEERQHAELVMKYLNKRGGNIKVEALPEPKATFDSAKEALTDALELEKEINQALLDAHSIASQANDPNMCDFIETHFLQEQVDAIKMLSDYIKQIDRCENQLGEYLFDKYMATSNMHKN